MTTKKQRRANVAAKTAAQREAERNVNLELLRIDREKRERREFDAQRAERKKATALQMRRKYEKNDVLPENLVNSIDEIGRDLGVLR